MWRHERADKTVVGWKHENGYWHIPGLVKEVESADAVLVDDSVIEPDEDAHWLSQWTEKYIDPTTKAEVTPGMKDIKGQVHIAGRMNTDITLRVLLFPAEAEKMTPKGARPSASMYKHRVRFEHEANYWHAVGAWVQESKVYEHNDAYKECSLCVDMIEPVDHNGEPLADGG